MSRTHRTVVVGAAVAAIVTASNASQGAYFSQSWGWVALAFLVPTTVLLVLGRVEAPGRLRTAFAVLVGALGVWIALSSIWSISTAATAREVERMLVYVAVALAVAFVLRRGDAAGVLGGALVGIGLVSAYALATRLFPDRLDTYDDSIISYRLAEPLGYWNALGLLATIGLVVAVGFIAHARRTAVVLVAAAATPILATTLYFTFSRGAWAALAIGLVVAITLDPRRLRLLWTAVVVAIPSAFCIGYASQQQALTTEDAPAAAAAREGHRVAVVLLVVVVAAALLGVAARAVSARVGVSRRARRGVDLALAGVAVVSAAAVFVAVGGPSGVTDRVRSEPVTGADLNGRLFNISANGRDETLDVAWESWRDRPVLGAGSGSFEYVWYEYRSSKSVVRDAHSLYMETLTELGLVGLALIVALPVLLLVGGIRARRHRFVPVGAAALVAWAAASALDWHWEMVGVTLTALLVGTVGLLASERGPVKALRGRARAVLILATTVLSVFAVWSLVGNQALFAAREALARKEWDDAADHARRAGALLFWSSEPDIVLGDAAAGRGDREGALRAYRDAVAIDPRSWTAWLHLAQVARGAERAAAYERVRALNPLEEGLPGE